jgi:hypothetical protein
MCSRLHLLFLAAAATVLATACDRQGSSPAQLAEFQKVAERFMTSVGTNRLTAVRELAAALPKCPITFSKDTEISHFRAYDYSRPSFRVSKEQITAALGPPHSIHTKPDSYEISYDVAANGFGHWYLSIEMRNDCAVNSLLHAWPPE